MSDAAAVRENELPVFTWDEIGAHNRRRDCWIVIDDFVYDVTSWIDRHPGGDIICSLAGEDVSALFHSSHFRDVPSRLLDQFRIGIVEESRAELDVASPFLTTLKKRVHAYFRQHEIDYRKVNLLRAQVVLSLLAFFAAWTGVYVFRLYPLAVAMGLISCAMVGGFAHEYCHSTLIDGGNKLNLRSMACSAVWSVLCPFMAEKHFQYEHLSHHLYPMSEDFDYEIFALRRVLRLAPEIPHRPLFRFQQFYAPLVYCFYITTQVIVGFTSRFFKRRKFSRDTAYIVHTYGMALITVAFHIVLPIYLIGALRWAICFLVYNAVWQCATYLVAAVVHMTGREETPTRDWAYAVCARSVNVLCGNRIYDWLSGGFNYQIDHHLLPTIARENLPLVNHIIRETCAEFGYPYKEYRSFTQYYADHYRYLAALGRGPAKGAP